MNTPKAERQKRALARRKLDVTNWMAEAVCAKDDGARDLANRKLFIAQRDVRALEAKLGFLAQVHS
jgi:hypothetical protein